MNRIAEWAASDHQYMARALQLATRGLNSTHPNPRVGCVIVRDGKILGEGWHRCAGDPHAEVEALRDAEEDVAGATCYVSLEPCTHHGRTPPCTQALIDAGIARIVAAMIDPDQRVAGEGLRCLEAAGIAAEVGLMEAEALRLNCGFVSRLRAHRPYVRCKLAMSLDGKTALMNGTSRWISGEAARRDVQHWRARSSALMTGAGTVIADDPMMTVRARTSTDRPVRQPLRVIVDRDLEIPVTARIVTPPEEALILTTSQSVNEHRKFTAAGIEVVVLQATRFFNEALTYLAQEKSVNELLLESGATLAGAMLSAGLIDELVLYIAPHLLGGDAKDLLGLPMIEAMRDRVPLTYTDVRRIGQDLRIRATVNHPHMSCSPGS